MGEITEVRVHGVSGTPPRAILRTDPAPVEGRPWSDDDTSTPAGPLGRIVTGVRRLVTKIVASGRKGPDPFDGRPIEISSDEPPEVPHNVIAYNWAKLTSGRPRHALWLLLLPYTLINIAGWMLPAKRPAAGAANDAGERALAPWARRGLDALVRIAAVVVTAVFTMFSAAILIDLVAAKCLPGSERCSIVRTFPQLDPWIWVVLGTSISALITISIAGVIGRAPSRRQRAGRARRNLAAAGGRIPVPAVNEPDPVANLTAADPSIWHPRRLTTRLLRIHTGVAFVAMAWLVSSLAGNTQRVGVAFWAPLVATVLIFGTVAAMSFRDHGPWLEPWTWGVAAAGISAYLVVILGARNLADLPWVSIGVEEASGEVSTWLTVIILFVAFVVAATGLFGPWSTSGSATLVVLSGLLGSSFGAGVYTLIRRMLTSGRPDVEVNGVVQPVTDVVAPLPGIDWAALGFLVFAGGLLGLIVWTLSLARIPPVAQTFTGGLRVVTRTVRPLLGWSTVIALGGGLMFVALEFADPDQVVQSPFEEISGAATATLVVLALLIAAGIVVTVARYRGVVWGAGVGVGIVVLYALVFSGRVTELKLLGATVRFDSIRELTVSLALVIPAGFIASRVWATLRDVQARRTIAILWDLASFWPRWYHPLAAPTYSTVAVPDLAAYVREHAANEGRVVLAAHSQGTVIAAAALLTFEPNDAALDRVGLLTYGSPLCHLYNRLFPAHFGDDAISALSARMGGRAGGCGAQPLEHDPNVRWRNLWRPTDPIGGDIFVPGVSRALIERLEDGHSSYEATKAYDRARSELIEMIQ